MVVAPRVREEETPWGDEVVGSPTSDGSSSPTGVGKTSIGPLFAAQVLFVLYVLWSFASARWSRAPELAVGGSILLTIQLSWALCVGYGLSSVAARLASRALVAIMAVTASVAVWYHYGRNPTLRADFPLGNPSFLATCLIPGILLSGCFAWERVVGRSRVRSRSLWLLIPAAVAIGLGLWAFRLADSRGPSVALLFGALAVVFFALRGRGKWVPVGIALAITVSGWFYFGSRTDTFSPTGRSATVRLRMYAWDYAWRMFNEKPFTGFGQGGFALVGDSHVVDDVLDDPLVFQTRIAHAHNEWLEVMADLGSVGIVLIAAALLLTLRAGMGVLAMELPGGHRWMLIGLMGTLVGLCVEECFGVGLRVSGIVTCFYTVLGLIWALSRRGEAVPVLRPGSSRFGRMVVGTGGVLLGAGILVMVQQDFAAARSVHRAKEALANGDSEEAIRLASLATTRLNPQRSLANLYRLGQAHLQAAQGLQQRAADRAIRAQEMEPPDLRLLALSQDDYRLSDKHCELGSGALTELVKRSPEFINHGWLSYWLTLTQAGNAGARNDWSGQEAGLKAAAVAINRELRRQPFVPEIAADYVRIQRGLVESASEFAEFMDVFARPLRHNRISRVYVDLLAELAGDPEFDGRLEGLLEEAIRAIRTPPIDEGTGLPQETWAPEKLRLVATVRFLRGDYRGAKAALELAAPCYDSLALSAPLGAASCWAELADCRFFLDPSDAKAALASAGRALATAPQSRSGRLLAFSVKTRMIDYALAAGFEDRARLLVLEMGAGEVGEPGIRRALGDRYSRMTESLLNRRDAGGLLRMAPAHLVPTFQRWLARAIELNPDDPVAHYLAADLAFHVGDDKAAAGHLRSALDRGLSPELALQFIHTALDRKPESEPLEELRDSIVPLQSPERRPEVRDGGRSEGPDPAPPG